LINSAARRWVIPLLGMDIVSHVKYCIAKFSKFSKRQNPATLKEEINARLKQTKKEIKCEIHTV